MKDTYWMVLAVFGFVALVYWIADLGARWWIERRQSAAAFRPQPAKEPSIWTRDLLATRPGRIFAGYLTAPVLAVMGVWDVVTQKAKWKGFEYHGFDAICIGIGVICLALVTFEAYGLPARSERDAGIRFVVVAIGLVTLVICFLTALLRNI